ncbi:IclR family transcriptional regulator [Streptomyces dysideae]|uniref:Glycerol operon regulatory protein n=1 Tax=Streptomyces dysideae TaxID=909626 RepID=A0A101V501_9ACTN|nr:IclR family transcriptional regulator [Streptomyces dysideae]KUO22608.1 hypothetical protein AQJ91_03095 [Streptomyces dysideae]
MTTHPTVPERSAVDRTLRILSAFDRHNQILTLSEISRRSGLPVATAHRIVTKLHRLGVLGRTTDGRYGIGIRLWEAGTLAPRSSLVSEIAQSSLVDLHNQTSAVALLVIRDGDESVCVSFVSRDPGHATAPGALGRRRPLHTTAMGLVLLAHTSAATGGEPGSGAPPAAGAGDPALQRRLAGIRRQGYAVAAGTPSPNVGGLAAPVRDAQGEVVAGVGVMTHIHAFQQLQLVSPVLAAAAAVSQGIQAFSGRDRTLDPPA